MNKKDAVLREQLIREIYNQRKNFSLNQHSKKYSVDKEILTSILEEFEGMGLVNLLLVNRSSDDDPSRPYLVGIMPKLHYFLLIDGGFLAIYKAQKIKTIWNIVKIVAAVINAIIIISIAVIGLYFQKRFNSSEKERETLEKRIDSMELHKQHKIIK